MKRRFLLPTGIVLALALPSATAAAPEQGTIEPLPPAADADHGTTVQGKPLETTIGKGGPAERRFVPREVIVRFEPGADATVRAGVLGGRDLELKERLPLPGAQLLRLPAGAGAEATARVLERLPGVLYAQPNYLRQPAQQRIPNDPRLRDLWGLHNTGQSVNGISQATADADIDAPEAWAMTTGSAKVTVAIADTGVAYDHPAIKANIWKNPKESVNGSDSDGNGYRDDVRGWDFVDNDNDPADHDKHGTHVAGTVAARGNDSHSIVGVSWNARLMPLRVLGPGGGSDADIASAFIYAPRNGAQIVNASLGGPGGSPLIADAVARNPKTLYVVAAGNDGANNDSSMFTPCNIPTQNLICVAATDQRDQLTSFSNYGIQNVDLAAPGNNILSATPAFRTPLVSRFQNASWQADPGGWTRDNTGSGSVSNGSGGWMAGQLWGLYDEYTADFGAGFALSDSPGLCWPGITHSGCYGAGASQTAYSPAFSLAGMHACTLRYWIRVDIAGTSATINQERVRVVGVSNQRGATAIHNWNGGPGSPAINPWTDDFSQFEGHTGVQVRLHMLSDNTYDGRDGTTLDDIIVFCQSRNFGPADFAFLPGTSMASPHVAGAAALALARSPGLSVAQLRSHLLGTVDRKPDLTTATATGGRLNAHSLLKRIDSLHGLTISNLKVKEGTGGKTTAAVTVSRKQAAGPVSVKFATANGSAKAPGDYKTTSGTLKLGANETKKQIKVPIVADATKEKNETFKVALSAPKNTTLLRKAATVTILNDD